MNSVGISIEGNKILGYKNLGTNNNSCHLLTVSICLTLCKMVLCISFYPNLKSRYYIIK